MSFLDRFADQGFLMIPSLFDPAFIERLRAEHETQFAAAEAAGLESQYEVGDKRIQLAVGLRGAFLDPQLWANPLLLPILHALLGPDVLLDSVSVVVARPGAKAQHRHRDHPALFPELASEIMLPAHAVSVMIPLIALDEQTGTTMLSPGTHRGAEKGQPVAAYMTPGGCYLMDYHLRHWGSANRSTCDRPLISLTYARQWFTDTQNFRHNPRLNISAEDARSVAERYRSLFRRLHPSPFPQVSSHKLSTEETA